MTRFVPLPRELFDRSLSDTALQDRWVEGATKQVQKLHFKRREWVHVQGALHPEEFMNGLEGLDEAIAEAEAFLQDAKQAQARHHQREQHNGPQHLPDLPPQVQALLTRRSPVEVQALLEGRAAQGRELAGAPSHPSPPKPNRPSLPKPTRSRRAVLKEQADRSEPDVLEAEWRPLLPKPTK